MYVVEYRFFDSNSFQSAKVNKNPYNTKEML